MKTKKKILWFSPLPIYPAVDGGKQGIYLPVIELAKYCDTHLVFLHALTESELFEQRRHFEQRGLKVTPCRLNTLDSIRKMLMSILRLQPFKFSKYHSCRVLQTLIELIEREQFDSIVFSNAHLCWYAQHLKKRFPHIQMILRAHTIDHELFRQYASVQSNPLIKLMALGQSWLTRYHEPRLWADMDKVLFISDSDVALAKRCRQFAEIKWAVAYDGRESIKRLTTTAARHILFPGALNTPQNRVSFKDFVDNYWRSFNLQQPTPPIELHVTGNIDDVICECLNIDQPQLAQLNIRSLGFVDDLPATIAEHAMVLSPTTMGVGIRVKVVEAMSQGALVILSPLDYGMCAFFQDGKNVITYHNGPEFREKALTVLASPDKATALREQAFNDAVHYFDWKILIDQIIDA